MSGGDDDQTFNSFKDLLRSTGGEPKEPEPSKDEERGWTLETGDEGHSDEDAERFDVMRTRVGTDPGLTLRTRRGTGYYKIPSLRAVWARGPFLHDGSVATLEDLFDPRRVDPLLKRSAGLDPLGQCGLRLGRRGQRLGRAGMTGGGNVACRRRAAQSGLGRVIHDLRGTQGLGGRLQGGSGAILGGLRLGPGGQVQIGRHGVGQCGQTGAHIGQPIRGKRTQIGPRGLAFGPDPFGPRRRCPSGVHIRAPGSGKRLCQRGTGGLDIRIGRGLAR